MLRTEGANVNPLGYKSLLSLWKQICNMGMCYWYYLITCYFTHLVRLFAHPLLEQEVYTPKGAGPGNLNLQSSLSETQDSYGINSLGVKSK